MRTNICCIDPPLCVARNLLIKYNPPAKTQSNCLMDKSFVDLGQQLIGEMVGDRDVALFALVSETRLVFELDSTNLGKTFNNCESAP